VPRYRETSDLDMWEEGKKEFKKKKKPIHRERERRGGGDWVAPRKLVPASVKVGTIFSIEKSGE